VLFQSELEIYNLADAAGLTPKLLSAEWDEDQDIGTLVTERWPMTLYELLDDTLSNGRPVAPVRTLFTQTLDLLDRLHSLNILHLDLHFHNFMVRPVGNSYELALIDFEYSHQAPVASIYKQVERWLLQMEIDKELSGSFGDPPEDWEKLSILLQENAAEALDLKARPVNELFDVFQRMRERFSQTQIRYWAVREY
jgi:serine/threonine protein kinase